MNIDLKMSWMVGDMTSDIEAAKRAGIRSILLTKQDVLDKQISLRPDAKCLDLNGAVDLILGDSTD
jgi:histidinol phosphatase-like enzyme